MSGTPANGPTAWAHTPERSNLFMLRLVKWLSLNFGRRLTRAVLHLITTYFLLFAPASRRASKSYLRRVFGRAPHWGELYRHIFTFAATIHDRVFFLNRRFDLFEFEVHGAELVHQLMAEGNGVFLMGAHLGSFEVIRALGQQEGKLRIAMLMHEENAQKINATLAAINPHAAPDIIPLGDLDSMLKLRERLDEGSLVGILADRSPVDGHVYPVNLLGAPANLPRGAFRIAALLRRPVVFMAGLYLGGNRYAIHFELLADFSALTHTDRDASVIAAMTDYAALLDKYCRLAPYNWFNFFDFWQAKPATAPPASL